MVSSLPDDPPPAGADTVQPGPVFFTIAEVARHLRTSERTIRRRIKDGTIRKVLMEGRLVRISIDELRRLSCSK